MVLTIVPSVWNSTSPSAVRNADDARGSSRCQSRIAPPCSWQTARIVLSQTTSPQNSRRLALDRSNDQLAPARQSNLWAWGLTNPEITSRSSSGCRVSRQRGQTRYSRLRHTVPAAVRTLRVACRLGHAAWWQSGQLRPDPPFFRRRRSEPGGWPRRPYGSVRGRLVRPRPRPEREPDRLGRRRRSAGVGGPMPALAPRAGL